MVRNMKKIVIIIIFVSILFTIGVGSVAASSKIVFKDRNLQDALCNYYKYDGDFTKEKAAELSKYKDPIIENANISDLEGIQYFVNINTLYIGDNNLKSLKPLSKLPILGMLNISNNFIKGKDFEKALNTMGRIENLYDLNLDNNDITNIDFLNKIGNINNYTVICMRNNKINDISALKDASNLDTLNLSNNRITDVTPLKDLDKLTFYIDLRDNCIIDYKPIKPLFDKMWEEFDTANAMDRYDYYTNPVDFKYSGKKIKFSHLTVYYKYQAYAEAGPLFKAFGGSAEYNKKTGTLTCKYGGNVLVMKDFSKGITYNGKKTSLKYPMRRMQYDLAYVPVKDICDILGLDFNVTETRVFLNDEEEVVYSPKLVEIGKNKKELG